MGRGTVNRPSQKDRQYVVVKNNLTGKTEIRENIAFEKGSSAGYNKPMAARAGTVMDSVNMGQTTRSDNNIKSLENDNVRTKALVIDPTTTAPIDSDTERLATILAHSDSFVGKPEHEAIDEVRQFTPAARNDGMRNRVDTGHSLSTLRSLGIAENDGKNSDITLTTYGQSLVDSATDENGGIDENKLEKGIVYAASRLPEVGLTREEVESDWSGGDWSDSTKYSRLRTIDAYREKCREFGFEPIDSRPGDASSRKQSTKNNGPREIGAGLPGMSNLSVDELMSEDDYARSRELKEAIEDARDRGDDDLARSLNRERRELIEKIVKEYTKK